MLLLHNIFTSLLFARTHRLSTTDKWFCPWGGGVGGWCWGGDAPYSWPRQGQTAQCVRAVLPGAAAASGQLKSNTCRIISPLRACEAEQESIGAEMIKAGKSQHAK